MLDLGPGKTRQLNIFEFIGPPLTRLGLSPLLSRLARLSGRLEMLLDLQDLKGSAEHILKCKMVQAPLPVFGGVQADVLLAGRQAWQLLIWGDMWKYT